MVIRKNTSYTFIHDSILDGSISLASIGLLAYVLQKEDEFIILEDELAAKLMITAAEIKSLIDELIEKGCVTVDGNYRIFHNSKQS